MAIIAKEPSALRLALRPYRSAFVTVGVLTAFLNVLMLGGSLYSMLIYDSALPSQSIPTLTGLLAIIVMVYAFQGVLETLRTRILSSVAAGLDTDLSPLIQRATFDARRRGVKMPGDGLGPMRDFDGVRAFLSGPGPGIIFDLPWMLLFLGVLAMLHVWLGLTALVGAVVMVALTWVTDRNTREATRGAAQSGAYRNGMAENMLSHVELLTALGMRGRLSQRWARINGAFRTAQITVSETVGLYGGVSKVLRMFLQSLILTVGALLVIDGRASGGVLFASSILSGRALAPLDLAIGNWRGFAAARLGWIRVNELLRALPPEGDARAMLPPPTRELRVDGLVVTAPGSQRVTVNGIGFRLAAGEAVGVIGPSAAGKTSLARALVGVWRPVQGDVRLDGATLDQWPEDELGARLGYLPQAVELLEGSVAENIARFDDDFESDAVVAAAQAAGVHELITGLPKGYRTQIGPNGEELSAGQRQRIGLARALYGDPFLVVLDEPNSNLDTQGDTALVQAIAGVRARGGVAVLISHRPSLLAAVSHVLVMQGGRATAFGPRDEVLAKLNPAIARVLRGANDAAAMSIAVPN